MVALNNSRISGAITLLITIFSLSLPVYAEYSGGTGDPNDPYQIATAADLIALGETPADYDKHFILTADIDLDPNLPGRKVFDRAVIAPGWETPFIGFLDGNGHTISHLTIEGSDYLGLCGQVGSWDARAGEIKNLGLVDVNIVGSGDSVGGLVGSNGRLYSVYSDGGTVTHCYSTGSVRGDQSVGGLVGSNMGEVANCHSTGTVRGGSSIGGLLGENHGEVTNCYSKSTVVGDYDSVGGLVGKNGGVFLVLFHFTTCGSVTQCYSTGAVTGTEDVGGLVGANPGNVLNCYSTSAVSADSAVGGLVGVNWVMPYGDTNATMDGLITNCYSTGVVIGNSDVGGLVGVGALFYSNEGHVTRSFWDIDASGQTASGGGQGLTTSKMQTSHTFSLWGTCDNEGIWTIDEGNNYPKLAWENQPGEAIHLPPLSDLLIGTGTESDPFLINTAEELNLIGLFPCEWDKCFKLMADVDLSGFDGKEGRPAFNVIGNKIEAFTGVFDGNGHIISHLTIDGGDYLGLFGYLSGEIKDLGVIDVNITGLEKSFIGGLVGYNYYHGGVLRCYTTGIVSGGERVGGLVGENDGYVTECHSTGVVTGRGAVGGLVGGQIDWVVSLRGRSYPLRPVPTFYGRVVQCYSTATVTGKWNVGGLLGKNDFCGSVIQCYSTGIVTGQTSVGGLVGSNEGVVSNSFWDIETSGQTSSAGGTGKTTAEMQAAATFLNAGWDFVGEIENGTRQVWQMPEDGGYPVLASFEGYTPPQLQGRGTAEEPYLISNPLELGAITHYPKTAHYRLAAPIDLVGIHWSIPVIPTFRGSFDGNGMTISNLNIKGESCLGLFGRLESGAEVRCLGIVNVNITASSNYVGGGGLVGHNMGTVTQCFSTGSVSGKTLIGGLVGYNDNWYDQHSSVIQCYSTVKVTGLSFIGGLVGSGGDVTQCYSAGAVSGWNDVGGMIGSGGATESFWDTQTSGQTDSAGGTGKTTAEMQTAKTFLDAGWDFVDEVANGTEDIWWILEGRDYPRLWWESIE